MAHLDMAKFIEANSDKIKRKFWILNSDRQAVAFPYDPIFVASDGEDHSLLPPMAGFFVEANDEFTGNELKLDYNADMAVVPDKTSSSPNWLSAPKRRAGTRSGSDMTSDGIRVTAVRNGLRENSTLLRIGTEFDAAYDEREDAETLVDPSLRVAATVFTVADGHALSINSTSEARGTEIGLMADEGAETVLLFEGEAANDGYNLYDAKTGKVHALHDGMEYRVSGPARSRLFLSDGPAPDAITGLRIDTDGHDVTVTPAESHDEVTVTVTDIAGIVVLGMRTEGVARFSLESGTYIIMATASDGSSAQCKVII